MCLSRPPLISFGPVPSSHTFNLPVWTGQGEPAGGLGEVVTLFSPLGPQRQQKHLETSRVVSLRPSPLWSDVASVGSSLPDRGFCSYSPDTGVAPPFMPHLLPHPALCPPFMP